MTGTCPDCGRVVPVVPGLTKARVAHVAVSLAYQPDGLTRALCRPSASLIRGSAFFIPPTWAEDVWDADWLWEGL